MKGQGQTERGGYDKKVKMRKPVGVSERERGFTVSRHIGEALVLASFPLAVAHVEVDVDRAGEYLVPIRRDFNEKGIL